MKFTKIKKRKFLETWQHKNRKTGIVSYIYSNPNGDYYFVISCFIKRCGLKECIRDRDKENCDKHVYYNSLDDELLYRDFDECRKAVIRWHRVWE